MCGQFAILGSLKAIKDYYEFLKNGDFLLDENDFYKYDTSEMINLPNMCIKPINWVPIVVANKKHINLISARWGLVPFWAKDESIANKTINARFETLIEKPSFKYAYQQRRCLIPFTSYAEKGVWFENENSVFKSFAGLYEVWGDNKLITFTIITCIANDEVAKVHHRMPLVLNENEAIQWLNYA